MNRTILAWGGPAFLALILGGLSGAPALTAQESPSTLGVNAPTFHKDVLPILQKNCQTAIGPARSGRCRC